MKCPEQWRKGAPRDFTEAISFFLDDDVAEKALKVMLEYDVGWNSRQTARWDEGLLEDIRINQWIRCRFGSESI